MKFLFVLFALSMSVFGQWSASESEPDTRGRAGSVRLGYQAGGTEGSLKEVLAALEKSGKVLLIDDCWTDLLKNKEENKKLVAALAQVSGSSPEDLSEEVGRGSFHNPEVTKFRPHLRNALLRLPQFLELSQELANYDLEITRVSCEKLSFVREEGVLLMSGAGVHLKLEPITYGLPAAKAETKGYLSLNKLEKEGEEWVGTFQLSTSEKEPARFYGKWSTEHDCYLIRQRDLAWTEGKEWGQELSAKISPEDVTFRIKPKLTYMVRIPLGKSAQPRAMVRIYSSGGEALASQEFILGTASYSFREE